MDSKCSEILDRNDSNGERCFFIQRQYESKLISIKDSFLGSVLAATMCLLDERTIFLCSLRFQNHDGWRRKRATSADLVDFSN